MTSRLREFADAALAATAPYAEKARVAAQPYVTLAVNAATAKAVEVKENATDRARGIVNPLLEQATAKLEETTARVTETGENLRIALDSKSRELQERADLKKREMREALADLREVLDLAKADVHADVRDRVAAVQDKLLALRMAAAKPESEAAWLERISAEVDKVVPRAQDEETAAPKVEQTATLNPLLLETQGITKVKAPIEPKETTADTDGLEAFAAGLAEMFKAIDEAMAGGGVNTAMLRDMEPHVKTHATFAPSHVRPLKLNQEQLDNALKLVSEFLDAAYGPKAKTADAPAAPARKARKPGPANG